jgi:SNF2 family DNA or RNA helicase
VASLHEGFVPKVLWPSQVSGIRFLTTREGAILGDEVGLGKTLQAIRAAQQADDIKNILVICPLNLRANLKHWWVQEITGEEMTEQGAPADRHVVKTDLLKNTPVIKVYDGPTLRAAIKEAPGL